jgi:hypothetical protein
MSVVTVSLASKAAFAAPHEPARGSAERKAVLDALRPAVEGRLGAPVEFVVKSIEVDRGFAFLKVEPQRPGGAAIDVKAMGLDSEFMDGLTTYALIKRQSGGWTLVDWALGPTDVAWWGWWDTYGAPRSIFPP